MFSVAIVLKENVTKALNRTKFGTIEIKWMEKGGTLKFHIECM